MELVQSQSVPEGGSFGRRHAVAFGVQVPSDLHGVAGLPLFDVLVHGRLQQVGVLPLRLPHSAHALAGGLDEHRGICTSHVRPHLLKNGYL